MRNVLRLRAAVKAVDAESKSRSAPSVEETLLDAEPVVTTVAQVAAPAPVAAPAAETTPAPGGSACKGEEGMKSEEKWARQSRVCRVTSRHFGLLSS
jgi:hypothetical protein